MNLPGIKSIQIRRGRNNGVGHRQQHTLQSGAKWRERLWPAGGPLLGGTLRQGDRRLVSNVRPLVGRP